ncbi:MAG: nitroreductase/quinone reductase family protein [Caulobacterales bacterium]
MSDETSNAVINSGGDWGAAHLQTYLRSGGAKGHIMDLTFVGGFPFTTHCLIKTRGRKSGKTFITALICGYINGEAVIVASKGGADSHPAWYLNLTSREEVQLQVATDAFRATWREPAGAEREMIWDYMVGVFPSYAGYQNSTARRIPIVMMKPAEPIAVFRESDVAG